MTEGKSKISIGQKVLIMVGIVSFSTLVLPFLLFVLFAILSKLMPSNGFITTFTTMLIFNVQGVILGFTFGLILAIIVIHRIEKSLNK